MGRQLLARRAVGLLRGCLRTPARVYRDTLRKNFAGGRARGADPVLKLHTVLSIGNVFPQRRAVARSNWHSDLNEYHASRLHLSRTSLGE